MKKLNLKSFIAGVLATILVISMVTTVLATQSSQAITATYRDIKITVNGQEISPKDANGNVVEPFIFNGTTYLPVRAVAESVGYDVNWDGDTNTVILDKKAVVEEDVEQEIEKETEEDVKEEVEETVSIILPASFYESIAEEDVINSALEDETIVKNDDGSYTFTMPLSTWEKALIEQQESVKNAITEMIADESSSFKDIKYNEAMTEFDFYVDQEKFEKSFIDAFSLTTIYFGAYFYQIFTGVPLDEMKVTFDLINNDTKEVFKTVVYPDALQ